MDTMGRMGTSARALVAFAVAAIVIVGRLSMAAADAPSMPAAHPNFQAVHVRFGPFVCEFHVKDETLRVGGVTELSSDDRRAVSHDPKGSTSRICGTMPSARCGSIRRSIPSSGWTSPEPRPGGVADN